MLFGMRFNPAEGGFGTAGKYFVAVSAGILMAPAVKRVPVVATTGLATTIVPMGEEHGKLIDPILVGAALTIRMVPDRDKRKEARKNPIDDQDKLAAARDLHEQPEEKEKVLQLQLPQMPPKSTTTKTITLRNFSTKPRKTNWNTSITGQTDSART